MKKVRIDFYKEFPLATPVVGLVEKIESPKGLKKQEDNGQTSYSFKCGDFWVYKNEPLELTEGIYKVLDICNIDREPTWNNYIFIIDSDGDVFPLGEFLNCPDTRWVKKALPLVKSYFAGDGLDSIELTNLRPKKEKKSGWLRSKK